PSTPHHAPSTDDHNRPRSNPQQRGMPLNTRPEQHELALTRDQKIDYLLVALTRLQSFAHEDTQIARERRIGIVDRLILADHAAQLLGESARACFQRSV